MRDHPGTGLAASDPAKVAQVVLRLVDSDDVPERLLLGTDALEVANGYEQAREAEKAKWIDVTNSTVHDDIDESTFNPTAHL